MISVKNRVTLGMIQMNEILEMSVAERILIIEKIWDSIDPNTVEIPDTHDRELQSRLQRYEKGETQFTTWEAIKAELNSSKR